jgi:ribonuclease P protein component
MRTVTTAGDIERLFKHGKRSSHPLLVIIAGPTPGRHNGEGRMLFVAGRRLGGAVMRNRCKRVMREACRRAGGPWEGMDVALIARAGAGQASADDLDRALGTLLSKLGVRQP